MSITYQNRDVIKGLTSEQMLDLKNLVLGSKTIIKIMSDNVIHINGDITLEELHALSLIFKENKCKCGCKC